MDTVPSTNDDPHAWMSLTKRERLQLNLRVLAERFNWPAGIVDQLVALENEYPAWTMWYGSEMFTARLVEPAHHHDPRLHGATVGELRTKLEAEEPRRISGWAD